MSARGVRRHPAQPLGLGPPSLLPFVTLALLAPIALAATGHWLDAENRRADELRATSRQSFDRQLALTDLLSRLKDAETSQRGFILTGDNAFLGRYRAAVADVRHAFAYRLKRDGAVDRVAIETMVALSQSKIAEMNRTIALRLSGRLDEALAVIGSGAGQRIGARVQAMGRGVIIAEQHGETRRIAAIEARHATTRRIMWLIIGVLSLLFAFALWVVWRSRYYSHGARVIAQAHADRADAILQSAADALLIVDPDGRIEQTNAAAHRMLGHGDGGLEGRDIATVLDLASGERSVADALGQPFQTDRVARRADGTTVTVDVALGAMNTARGRYLVVSLHDTAERRRHDRLKDELISTVSHELRTPLTSIVGALGLLRAGVAGTLPEEAARLVEIGENNSRRLIRLINDMLDIDRIGAGKLRMERSVTDLRAVAARACRGAQAMAAMCDVLLDFAPPDGTAMVLGDADRLLQVISNLIANAIRVAPSGSTVMVALFSDADGRIVVAVDDEGPGVPAELRPRLFGRFERAAGDDGGTGTGLGLAISREIIRQHDGRIWFEDRTGGGTRFAFSLDRLPDEDDGRHAA